MNKWLTKIFLPLLIVGLVAALYYGRDSVKTIDLEPDYSVPPVDRSRSVAPSRQARTSVKSRLDLGAHYSSLDDLIADQKSAGYLKTGYFGKFWPATVTEITNDSDGIVFIRQGGTRHNYTGFDGYRMKMVRLSGGGKRETIVVFRSVQKR